MRVDAEFDSASGLWLSVNPNEDCFKYNLLQRASQRAGPEGGASLTFFRVLNSCLETVSTFYRRAWCLLKAFCINFVCPSWSDLH